MRGIPYIGQLLSFLKDTEGMLSRGRARHGKMFIYTFLGNSIVSLNNKEANQYVLVEKGKQFASQQVWEDALGDLFPNGLMLMDGDRHAYHRSILRTAFTKQPMQGYLDIMPEIIVQHFQTWKGKEDMLVFPEMKTLTLTLAGRVFFGLDFSQELEHINQDIIQVVKAATTIPINLPFTTYGKGIRARKRLERFFYEILPSKRAKPEKDLFSILCQATNEEGNQLTDQEVIDHLIFILMAAHDTTASTLSSICYLLAKHPDWQEVLREELKEIDLSGPLTPQSLRQFPQTGLVIKETLRLYPPLILIPRMATADMEIGGYEIPDQTYVNLQIQHHHRTEEIWTDPEVFDPTRFDKERKEDKKCPFGYVPFGAGAHHCLGFSFAEMQIRLILAELLKQFRWSVPDEYEAPYQMIPIQEPKDGLPVRLYSLNAEGR